MKTTWQAGTIESAVSAACQATQLTHQVDISSQPLILQAKKKMRHYTHRASKYCEFYDPLPIFSMIQDWGDNETLTETQLRDKVLLLLRIDLMARSDDLVKLYRGTTTLEVGEDHLRVRFVNLKQGEGFSEWIRVQAYPDNPAICTVRAVAEYLKRTTEFESKSISITVNRGTFLSDPLIMSADAKHTPLTPDTVGALTSRYLHQAGISKEYTAHSLKGATISKALMMGVSMERLAPHARTKPETIRKHYQRLEVGSNREVTSRDLSVTHALRSSLPGYSQSHLHPSSSPQSSQPQLNTTDPHSHF